MAEVTLQIRDANGVVREVRAEQGADGVLTPIHQIQAPSGGLPVQLSRVTAAGADVTGSGTQAGVSLGVPTQAIEFYNGGAGWASVTSGSVTRQVPAGTARVCHFPDPTSAVDVVADGDWFAVALS